MPLGERSSRNENNFFVHNQVHRETLVRQRMRVSSVGQSTRRKMDAFGVRGRVVMLRGHVNGEMGSLYGVRKS
jgi:hypothetical protein